MGDVIYRVENLRKVYGERVVVDIEQLEVRRSEVLALAFLANAAMLRLQGMTNIE